MSSENDKWSYAIKKNTKRQAWELGKGSDMEKKLIETGKLVARDGGIYEVFTREATEGKGQIANSGDFFKVDGEGYPSPCERSWFFANHKHVEGDWYEQVAKPLKIWRKDDPETEEIKFLIDSGALNIHSEDLNKYYSAFLWGTMETAASDAVIVLYSVDKDDSGKIDAISFNFVEADYFKANYKIIDK
ncbi:MAG: hypothetical protein IKZ42_05290 [Clostridiales bacterium]|nr:hypothetical protein [Clostridiales bacterium]